MQVGATYRMHGHHRPGGDVFDWTAHAASVKQETDGGGVVLVVGADSHVFPASYQEHAKLLLWSNTNASRDALLHRQVPAAVRVIVTTRWMAHKLSDRLVRIARQRGLRFYPTLSPGEVKRLLEPILVQTPVRTEARTIMTDTADPVLSETPPASGPPPLALADEPHEQASEESMAKRDQPRGWLKTIILDEVKSIPSGMTMYDVGAKLYESLKKRGYQTSLGSVRQAVRQYVGPGAAEGVTKPGKGKGGKGTTAEDPLISDVATARRMLIEARTAIDVVMEQLNAMEAEVLANRTTIAKFKTLLGGI